jgi:hypothetical protein
MDSEHLSFGRALYHTMSPLVMARQVTRKIEHTMWCEGTFLKLL